MGLITQDYSAAASTALTITLASLATGGFRESTVVDNTSNKYLDAIVGGKITTGTSPTADTLLKVWLYCSWDSTDYIAGLTGSDASYSAGQEALLVPAEYITVTATSDVTYEFGGISVAQAFGQMPPKWGVLVKSETAVNLNSTASNHAISYWGIKKNAA